MKKQINDKYLSKDNGETIYKHSRKVNITALQKDKCEV